jgi:hypothetical protein
MTDRHHRNPQPKGFEPFSTQPVNAEGIRSTHCDESYPNESTGLKQPMARAFTEQKRPLGGIISSLRHSRLLVFLFPGARFGRLLGSHGDSPPPEARGWFPPVLCEPCSGVDQSAEDTKRPAPFREPGVREYRRRCATAYAVRIRSLLSPLMAACAAASRAMGTR